MDPSDEQCEIPPEMVTYSEKIGNGSFGTVYKWNYFGPVAIKQLKISSPSAADLLAFKNEAELLKNARHPNILNFLGVILKPELAIVTEWCQGSSLYRQIHVIEPTVEFSVEEVVIIAQQVSQGMQYLHWRGVAHRDLKTSNVFLSERMCVKIGDFGLAAVKAGSPKSNEQPYPDHTGSIPWMAPEVIRSVGSEKCLRFSPESDVYSFGICLYELLTSSLPYENIPSRDQILYMVGSGLLRPNLKRILRTDVPNSLKNLLRHCIAQEPTERPTFQNVTWALQLMQAEPADE